MASFSYKTDNLEEKRRGQIPKKFLFSFTKLALENAHEWERFGIKDLKKKRKKKGGDGLEVGVSFNVDAANVSTSSSSSTDRKVRLSRSLWRHQHSIPLRNRK
ncbi:hypothetical protein IMY05_016G0031500 [Salix suchowensis]|nr:hypothetical protein IMY05_016G0031500 [Salix suchowensis]